MLGQYIYKMPNNNGEWKVKQAEFQGFVKANLENINNKIDDMHTGWKEQVVKCDARFCRIEEDVVKNKIGLTKIIGIPAIISGIISVLALTMKYLLWK